MKIETFNTFCHVICDRMYEPKLPERAQSTGYINLKKMVVEKIQPASLEEMERWETNPTIDELLSPPDIKYLRFLHPNLRRFVVENWDKIKDLEV